MYKAEMLLVQFQNSPYPYPHKTWFIVPRQLAWSSGSLLRRRSLGSSRNLSLVGEERLRDEPKERLRGRLV